MGRESNTQGWGKNIMVKYLKRCILLLFFIPYIYFALLLDYRYHSIFGLIFLIFLSFYAGFIMQKKARLLFLIPGNITTTASSYLVCHYYTDWHFFYQPFSPSKLILLLAVIYLIPQITGIFWARIFTQEQQNINIFK